MRAALLDDLQEIRRVAAEGRLDEARQRLSHLTTHRVPLPGDHLPCAELAMELGLLKVAERELQLELRDLREHPHAGREVRVFDALAEVLEALGQRARAHGFRSLAARAKGEPPQPPLRQDPLGGSRATMSQGDAPAPTPVSPRKSENLRGSTARSGVDKGSDRTQSLPRRGQRPEGDESRRTKPSGSSQGLKPPRPSDVGRFRHLFSGRENIHARQWLDPSGRGGYSPVHKPLTHELLAEHFAGTMTLGVYQTRIDGSVTFFALDLDATKPALSRALQNPRAADELAAVIQQAGLRMQRRARELGLELLLEDSGYKGRHLWGFLETPMASGLIRNFVKALGRQLAPKDDRLVLEYFPKQEKLGSDQIGNLIKLPLGIHLKTGRRSQFLDSHGEVVLDPWRILAEVRRHRHDEIMEVFGRLKAGGAPTRDTKDETHRLSPPEAAPPDFIDSDFGTDPSLRAVLGGCAVLRDLVTRGLGARRLNHDEQIVLRHTLGHIPIGLAAVNFLFRRCPEVPVVMHLKSVLSGNPISCPKIRKKIPQVTSRVPCNCHFGDHLDHYPTPTLHLRGVPRAHAGAVSTDTERSAAGQGAQVTDPTSSEPPPKDVVVQAPAAPAERSSSVAEIDDPRGEVGPSARNGPPTGAASDVVGEAGSVRALASRYWRLVEQAHRVGLELSAAELDLLKALEREGGAFEDAEGRLEVVKVAGIPKLRFISRSTSEAT